jgi:hypothetical protein
VPVRVPGFDSSSGVTALALRDVCLLLLFDVMFCYALSMSIVLVTFVVF